MTARCGGKEVFCFTRKEEEGGVAVEWSGSQECKVAGEAECGGAGSEERLLSWEKEGFSIWDRRLVPELMEEEISRYGEYTFVFQYSKASFIPEERVGDGETRKRFVDAMLRQQMTVLGLLAPKVRAQRHALRRAVSGIMGRNMSHNIGSHVLARYASKIRDDVVAHEKKDDQRSDLLQYLQRRMDFLADVATSDRAFWFQSLSLKEQIDRLNWDAQKRRFNKSEDGCAKPVLLRFITGKEGLKATVSYEECDDVYFASPGGEVGVHALFVILENIIRNSARHGRAESDPVELEVSLHEHDEASDLVKLEIDEASDLVKLEIVDSRSPVGGRQVILTLESPVEAAAAVVSYEKPADDRVKPLRDTECNCVKMFRFPQDGGANAGTAGDAAVPVAAAVTGNSLVLTFNKELDAGSVPTKEAFCVTAGGKVVSVSEVTIPPRLDDRINKILKEAILTSDGEPKAENWGVREMQICAHYLRGFSLYELEDDPGGKYPVLEAGCTDGGNLKYTIYLRRAKRMAVVRNLQGQD